MRIKLIVVCLFVTVVVNANTYYVATNGSDSNPGTIGSPFATWGKLSSVLVAGDIAYIRGGTYRSKSPASANEHVGLYSLNGNENNNIRIFAYPGEKPVLNLDNITPTSSYCFAFFMQNCQYVYINGLRITGLSQSTSGNSITGMYIANSPNCIFEQCEVDHIGGYGIALGDGSDNILFKNCDVHHCSDRYTSYENANGFMVTGGSTATNITYDGCRAWNCSDDGWDFFLTDGTYTINNCWSFWNGYDDSFNYLGDGQGFKLGPTRTDKSYTHIRTITKSIAAKNSHNGFDQNSTTYSGIQYFYNNTAYDNGNVGFSFNYLNGIANQFVNNISFGNDVANGNFGSGTIQSNNTWNGGPAATASDFESNDISLLASPRQDDGSLPDIAFLRLNTGSDLIDAGKDVGLTYNGNAPDLGSFEYQSGPIIYVPVYQSSVVENASPSIIVITYNSTLANIIPAVSAFSVTVNSIARPVTSVAISESTVRLTLASPITYGDIIAITYTRPSVNPVQTPSGGLAVSGSDQHVTNKVSTVDPVCISSAIANATPSLLEMTYNLALSNIVPSAAAFKVTVNSVARTVSSVSVSGTKVQLTLSSPVIYGDVVTVSYTKPSTNPLQTSTGGQAASIAAQAVTNNVSSVNPLYLSSGIENSTPTLLDMTFNTNLANVIPAASSFSVTVNSSARTVNAVTVSGTKVSLTLSSAVVYGDIVRVSYTRPATNFLQSGTGGQVASFSAQSVVNRVNPVSPPVYISSSIENATPSQLEILFNSTLTNIVPSASAFSVNVNSITRTVNAVVISYAKVILTLSSPVVYGDVVKVTYNKPTVNPLQTSSGNQASSFSNQLVTNRVTTVIPVYTSSSIENATPSQLEILFNTSLANIVSSASAFSVTINSVGITVSTVVISNTKVLLTLTRPVIYGDVVKVTYNKPTVNPLQTSSGNQASSFSNQLVTNRVTPVIPVYTASSIENATPSQLEILFNASLANIVPIASSFSVNINSVGITVSTVVISNTKVLLTLTKPVIYGDVVTIAYAKPTVNPLQTSSGGQVASISTQLVTNGVSPVPPVYVSSEVQNANPLLLIISFSALMAQKVPLASAFSVTVNKVARTINSVSVSGTIVTLTLSSAVVFGDVITVGYIKPSNNPLQTDSGGQADSFSATSVTNNCLKNSAGTNGTKIQIYPNPARTYINISINEETLSTKIIRIFDSSGKLVLTKILDRGITDAHIPLMLNPGIYTVTFESGSIKMYSQKLIVM